MVLTNRVGGADSHDRGQQPRRLEAPPSTPVAMVGVLRGRDKLANRAVTAIFRSAPTSFPDPIFYAESENDIENDIRTRLGGLLAPFRHNRHLDTSKHNKHTYGRLHP